MKKAESYFKKAIKIIEHLRAPLAAEEFRMAFLSDKLAPFENLAKIYLDQNRFKEAFLMIERSRSRSLAESLGEVVAGEITGNISTKLMQKLENLREELNWFYSRLNRAEENKMSADCKRKQKGAKNKSPT